MPTQTEAAKNLHQQYCSDFKVFQLYTHQLPSGFIAVNGTPADGIYLALNELYPETDFDCVITGINSGLLTDMPILDICKNLPYHVLNVNIPDVGI
ncbi:hypothetical protein Psyc_0689 [Psychrobacter arcticus 273-4]|uniref:5'-nucleotidase n=1 Tax=Psychrobacter arcticus (strain DSM 17307 / VKM B-2377 / 273-4) TaxID=259536 RepID=Q4FTW0_PSYA2|nr:hypothetical protein Psyc_0689 [Psychrobacter arcticus 273-4]